MGTALGCIGHWLRGDRIGAAAFYFIALSGLLLAAREWGWITFELPEWKRQTEKYWANEFGFVGASVMWGLHIGLGFATRVTYSGFWILVLIALAIAEPGYGAALMLIYWLGRAFSVWIAPRLMKSTSDAAELPTAVLLDQSLHRRFVGVGLLWLAAVTTLLAVQSQFHHGFSLFSWFRS